MQEVAKSILDLAKKAILRLSRFFHRYRKTLLLVVLFIVVTIVVDSLILTSVINNANENNEPGDNDKTIPASGVVYVRGLDVYGGDLKSQSGKSNIDWGELGPGAYSAVSFYVKNTGTEDVTIRLEVNGWTPVGLGSFMNIFWNRNGTILTPQQEILVTVTLSVSSSDEFIDYLVENQIQTFSFDMTIYALGQ